MSANLEEFLKTGIGFRFDNTSKCKYSFEEMLNYEINELGNTDIFCTIKDLHNINVDNIEGIIKFCKDRLNSDTVYYKWVCSNPFESMGIYQDGGLDIHIVKFSEPFIVISDLNREGLLVVTSNKMIDYVWELPCF